MTISELRREQAAGRTGQDLARMAADRGITLDILDGLTCWTPIRYPDEQSFIHSAFKDSHDFSPDEAFRACECLGLTEILAVAGFETCPYTVSTLVDCFGEFCRAAAAHGLRVDLEPLPMMGVSTLRQAWDIVRGTGTETAGILIDTWHFMRGGADFELLRAIPRGTIRTVQIGDAKPKRPEHSPWQDAMESRVLPGQGNLPIAEIMTALYEHHDIASVGLELVAPEITELDPLRAGQRIGEILDTFMPTSQLGSAVN